MTEQSRLIFGVTIFTQYLISMDGGRNQNALMVIFIAIIKQHHEEAEQEHRVKREVMNGVKYRMNCVLKY